METKQASSQTFCGRCGFARSGHGFLPAACSGFVEKKPEKPRRLALVVQPHNALARDAAISLLKNARQWMAPGTMRKDIDAAIVCLESIS